MEPSETPPPVTKAVSLGGQRAQLTAVGAQSWPYTKQYLQ